MFWDSVAGVYDLFVNVVNRRTHLALRKIVANLIQPSDNVLECACGTGLLTEVIAQKCGHLTATDFAPKMLAKARKNCAAFGNITFEPADITSLGYPDGSFDAVVAGNVIHLLDDPLKALNELDRVCKIKRATPAASPPPWERPGRTSSGSSRWKAIGSFSRTRAIGT